MTRHWKPLAAVRVMQVSPLLLLLAAFAIVGGTIFALTVPNGKAAQRIVGTVTAITEAPSPRSGGPTQMLSVRMPAGATFVVALPNGLACKVGQSVAIDRRPVLFGIRTAVAPEACRGVGIR